jgi:hypothetical protein
MRFVCTPLVSGRGKLANDIPASSGFSSLLQRIGKIVHRLVSYALVCQESLRKRRRLSPAHLTQMLTVPSGIFPKSARPAFFALATNPYIESQPPTLLSREAVIVGTPLRLLLLLLERRFDFHCLRAPENTFSRTCNRHHTQITDWEGPGAS